MESKKSERGSECDTDEDEEEDYVEDLKEVIAKKKNKGPRVSVSAEAYGMWNKKEAFKARVIPKGEDSKTAIREKLNKSFMFAALNPAEKDIVIDAMQEIKAPAHEVIIKEGDQGDCLYVVGSGTLECTKIFPGQTDPTFLLSYTGGAAFGELALLYNAPRAATIETKDECVLWQLDRDTFNHIVKDSAIRRREKYEAFLEKVTIFSTMEPYERARLADAFTECSFKAGDYIIKEGDKGDDLFLLQEGEAYAVKVLNAGEEPTKVMDYVVGGYFGERALIKSEPRAASIIAKTDCVLVSMDRHSVKRLLGPLETLLKRNFEMYEKFALNKQ